MLGLDGPRVDPGHRHRVSLRAPQPGRGSSVGSFLHLAATGCYMPAALFRMLCSALGVLLMAVWLGGPAVAPPAAAHLATPHPHQHQHPQRHPLQARVEAFRASLLDAWSLAHTDAGDTDHVLHSMDEAEKDLERFLFGEKSSTSNPPPLQNSNADSHTGPKAPSNPNPDPLRDFSTPARKRNYRAEREDDYHYSYFNPKVHGLEEEVGGEADLRASRIPTTRPRLSALRTLLASLASFFRYAVSLVLATGGVGMRAVRVSFATLVSASGATSYFAFYSVLLPVTQKSVTVSAKVTYVAFTIVRRVVLEALRPVRILVAAPILYLFLGFYLVFIQAPYRLFNVLAREGYPIYLFLAAGTMAGIALGIGAAFFLVMGTALINDTDTPAPHDRARSREQAQRKPHKQAHHPGGSSFLPSQFAGSNSSSSSSPLRKVHDSPSQRQVIVESSRLPAQKKYVTQWAHQSSPKVQSTHPQHVLPPWEMAPDPVASSRFDSHTELNAHLSPDESSQAKEYNGLASRLRGMQNSLPSPPASPSSSVPEARVGSEGDSRGEDDTVQAPLLSRAQALHRSASLSQLGYISRELEDPNRKTDHGLFQRRNTNNSLGLQGLHTSPLHTGAPAHSFAPFPKAVRNEPSERKNDSTPAVPPSPSPEDSPELNQESGIPISSSWTHHREDPDWERRLAFNLRRRASMPRLSSNLASHLASGSGSALGPGLGLGSSSSSASPIQQRLHEWRLNTARATGAQSSRYDRT